MKVLTAVTSSFLALFICGCSGLFYYPDSNMYYDPNKLAIKPSQHELTDRKGRKIVGWYFQNKSKRPTRAKILFFHGNAQNISSHFVSLYWILENDYDFFIFDYPGYGGSEGEPDRDSVVESSYTALKWLHEQKPHVPIAVFGQSLGGNISLYTVARYQKELPVCQVTVDSTFLSYRKVAQSVMASNKVTWLFQWVPYLTLTNYKSASENIDKISPTPLIVIHGNKDRHVSFENGEQVFKAALEPKEFWPLPQGQHIDSFTGPHKEEMQKKYLQALARDCQTHI